MIKWAQSTLQETGDLAEDPLDSRTQYHHEEPSHVFLASKPMIPMHCYMVQYFDLQTYSEAMINPLWEASMQEEYDSLLKNQTWDLVPLPPGKKIFRSK
jgi:hypothetical protein